MCCIDLASPFRPAWIVSPACKCCTFRNSMGTSKAISREASSFIDYDRMNSCRPPPAESQPSAQSSIAPLRLTCNSVMPNVRNPGDDPMKYTCQRLMNTTQRLQPRARPGDKASVPPDALVEAVQPLHARQSTGLVMAPRDPFVFDELTAMVSHHATVPYNAVEMAQRRECRVRA